MKKAIALLIGLVCGSAALAVTDSTFSVRGETLRYNSKGSVEMGEWTCQFAKARKQAKAEGVPFLVYWGNNGCSHCEDLESRLAGSAFVKWQRKYGIYMAISINNAAGALGAESSAAYSAAIGSAKALTAYPFVGVYWEGKERGVFSGNGMSAETFIAKVESLLKNWTGHGTALRLTLKTNGSKYGSVSGGGYYEPGKRILLKATAKDGYVFTGWFSDEDFTKPLNPAGYDNRKPSVKYTMPAKAKTIYARFNSFATDAKALKFSASTAKLAKTAKSASVGSSFTLKLGISSRSLVTVSASGLPSGLAIDPKTGTISGTAAKPGAYTAKVTVRSAAGNTISQKVRIDVKAPSWSVGDFFGYGYVVVNGKIIPVISSFSANAVGSVSGKVVYRGSTCAFTASYSSAKAAKAVFQLKFKAGGKTFKAPVTIRKVTHGLTYVTADVGDWDFELALQKKVPLVRTGKSLAKMVGKSYTFKPSSGYEDSGLTKKGDKLVVKFKEKDKVAIAGIVGGVAFSGVSAPVMACGKSKSKGGIRYKLAIPVIEPKTKYGRILVFKPSVARKGGKILKVGKRFDPLLRLTL